MSSLSRYVRGRLSAVLLVGICTTVAGAVSAMGTRPIPDLSEVMREVTDKNGKSNFDKVSEAYDRLRRDDAFFETGPKEWKDKDDEPATPGELSDFEQQIEKRPEDYGGTPDEDLPQKNESGKEVPDENQGPHGSDRDGDIRIDPSDGFDHAGPDDPGTGGLAGRCTWACAREWTISEQEFVALVTEYELRIQQFNTLEATLRADLDEVRERRAQDSGSRRKGDGGN